MNKLMITILILAGVLIGGQVQAHGAGDAGMSAGAVEQVDVNKLGRVDYQFLFEMVSEPGEELDAFITRMAPRMRDWTAAEGFESCGMIATNGERFGVTVGTSRGHTICVNFHAKVPSGMTATSQNVHSHTTMPRYRANANDMLVLGSSARLGQVVRGDHPDLFSNEDFMAPGYMISSDKVWHQTGKGSVRMVGNL